MKYRLGVDVGGTNTDAVVLDQDNQVLASTKAHTTADIKTGIANAVSKVMTEGDFDRSLITTAMLGTTQCTNAIVERKHLAKVGVIRLGYPNTAAIPSFFEWDQTLVDALQPRTAILHGGYRFDGRPITKLDESEVLNLLDKWRGKVDAIAVVGCFSSVKDDQEKQVAELIYQSYGNEFEVSLSSAIGSLGLVERENATILNAALKDVIRLTTAGFVDALHNVGIDSADLYLCQNDGTLMSIEYARKHPILTIGSGPTNSIRGAAFLSQKSDAIVLDIGGTTSDVGVLTHGFPRESSVAVTVGGVRTNFRMPDINSIGLGGGSIVHVADDGSVTIGPDSVGYQITDKALVFGGDTLTATDIAVRLGLAKVGDPDKVANLDPMLARRAGEQIAKMLEDAIDSMKTSAGDADLILVGGGAIIAPPQLKGVQHIFRDPYGKVANAIGATIAQIGGEYERMYTYDEVPRKDALADAEQAATNQAITAGADPATVSLVEVNETPLAYAPGNATKVRAKVVGNILM